MSFSTSSSEAPASEAKKTAAPMFLAAMVGGAALTAAALSLAPEDWIHKAPEYGMAEAFEDHIEQACGTGSRRSC